MVPSTSLSTGVASWLAKLKRLQTDMELYVVSDRFKRLSLADIDPKKDGAHFRRLNIVYTQLRRLLRLREDVLMLLYFGNDTTHV